MSSSSSSSSSPPGVSVAPLRSLDDFLTGQARFQLPDLNNEDRWFNRIINNLLYYQTNYFLSAAVIFALVAFAKPDQMAYGVGTMMILFGLLMLAQSQKAEVEDFRRRHPLFVTLGVFGVGHWLIYQLGCIVVFLLGVALPVAFIIGHASLRLRNVRNKLANAGEALGLAKKTPMALILESVGIEADLKFM